MVDIANCFTVSLRADEPALSAVTDLGANADTSRREAIVFQVNQWKEEE